MNGEGDDLALVLQINVQKMASFTTFSFPWVSQFAHPATMTSRQKGIITALSRIRWPFVIGREAVRSRNDVVATRRRHWKLGEDSCCPNAKIPPGAQPSGVLLNLLDLPCGKRDAPTPQPSRPADLEGEGVRLLLFLRRRLRPSSCAPGIASFLQLRHLERPSRPRPVAKRHGRENRSQHL
jgi:hypothetical protein